MSQVLFFCYCSRRFTSPCARMIATYKKKSPPRIRCLLLYFTVGEAVQGKADKKKEAGRKKTQKNITEKRTKLFLFPRRYWKEIEEIRQQKRNSHSFLSLTALKKKSWKKNRKNETQILFFLCPAPPPPFPFPLLLLWSLASYLISLRHDRISFTCCCFFFFLFLRAQTTFSCALCFSVIFFIPLGKYLIWLYFHYLYIFVSL